MSGEICNSHLLDADVLKIWLMTLSEADGKETRFQWISEDILTYIDSYIKIYI